MNGYNFRNADPPEQWQKGDWEWQFVDSSVDRERKSICLRTETTEQYPAIIIPLGSLPCRVTFEITETRSFFPQMFFHIHTRTKKVGEVTCHRSTESAGRDHTHAWNFYKFPGDNQEHTIPFQFHHAADGRSFRAEAQLPMRLLNDIEFIVFRTRIYGSNKKPGDPDKLDVYLLDIVSKFDAHTGLSIASRDDIVFVEKLDDKKSAFRSGLQVGDAIIRFNGAKRSAEQIQKILDDVQFGDPLTIAVVRDGEEKVFRFHAE